MNYLIKWPSLWIHITAVHMTMTVHLVMHFHDCPPHSVSTPGCCRRRLNMALVLFVLILCYMVLLVKDACVFVLYLIYFVLWCEVVSLLSALV